jgi:membrane-bound metal-dependent hydrolase YbcI (DUF457 family)
MADFKTHLGISTLAASAAATTIFCTGVLLPEQVVAVFLLGITGGLLPDIDSDSSVPLKVVFNILAAVLAFLIMFTQRQGHSVLELFLIWIGGFFLVKYLVFAVFTRITVHRGMLHSIPCAVLFGLMTSILAWRWRGHTPLVAWTGGCFVTGGMLLHLLLDELHSMNFFGGAARRSLGSALKLVSFSDLKTTALIYILIPVLFPLTPEHDSFMRTFFDADTYASLSFLPHAPWFHALYDNLLVALSSLLSRGTA